MLLPQSFLANNGQSVAPVWENYNWQDILIAGIENVEEGTIVATSKNVNLGRNKSAELKIEILRNILIDDAFFANNTYNFLNPNIYEKKGERRNLFEKGNRCLALKLTHGEVSDDIVIEIPCKNTQTILGQSQCLYLHELLINGAEQTSNYFQGTGIGHIALSFVKQLALHEKLDISLASACGSKGFYGKEQFHELGKVANEPAENYMRWNR